MVRTVTIIDLHGAAVLQVFQPLHAAVTRRTRQSAFGLTGPGDSQTEGASNPQARTEPSKLPCLFKPLQEESDAGGLNAVLIVGGNEYYYGAPSSHWIADFTSL
jgi:hypothetical protein